MGAGLSNVVIDNNWRPGELPWENTKSWAVVEGLEKNPEWNGRTVEVTPSAIDGCADIKFYGSLIPLEATVPVAKLTTLNPIEGCRFCARPHTTRREQVQERFTTWKPTAPMPKPPIVTIKWGKAGEGKWQTLCPAEG